MLLNLYDTENKKKIILSVCLSCPKMRGRNCVGGITYARLTPNTSVIRFDYTIEPSMDEKSLHLDKLFVNRASETKE